jgi:hypothetical protein
MLQHPGIIFFGLFVTHVDCFLLLLVALPLHSRAHLGLEAGADLEAAGLRGHNLEALLASIADSPGGTHLGEVGFGAAAVAAIWSAKLNLYSLTGAILHVSTALVIVDFHAAKFGQRSLLPRHVPP